MQKVINVLAVASFGISAALAAGVATAYFQRDAIKGRVMEEASAFITEAIGEAVSGAVGDLPSLLGGGGESYTPSVPGLPF
jgi:hypothetical protein